MADKLYIVYYPIQRDTKGTWGGPLCIMGTRGPAYPAFHSVKLAETFRRRVESPGGYEILSLAELGEEHPELVRGVKDLLVFPSAKVLDEYFTARKNKTPFPFEKYLASRETV